MADNDNMAWSIYEGCRHIYGFDNGYSEPDDFEYEPPMLIINGSAGYLDIKFNYCPVCGDKLSER